MRLEAGRVLDAVVFGLLFGLSGIFLIVGCLTRGALIPLIGTLLGMMGMVTLSFDWTITGLLSVDFNRPGMGEFIWILMIVVCMNVIVSLIQWKRPV